MKEFIVKGVGDVLEQADVLDLTSCVVLRGSDAMQVSDGYHTMDELYDHRITLFIALTRMQEQMNRIARELGQGIAHPVWRSKAHHPDDKPMFEGWFILGMNTEPGRQITYHLPLSRWDECESAQQFMHAPKWDGHTPADVLERLKCL